ncbi:hypothetical protein [Taibaiella koreensis]|uniref:hypothetical protein n=1 Tax=Taibaiella koreensis TaxID=1268548 RepID=UPI0013C2F775|nr:hypothetical protein [Taibaiella koreensis]
MKRLLLSAFALVAGLSALLFEQIVTACGGGEDPYDYYTTFFHNNLAGSPAYMPFYFVTGYQYYDDWNYDASPDLNEDENLKEWVGFGQDKFKLKDAHDFIYRYSYNQLSNLYYHIEKGNALQLPDSVQRNGMTQWFLAGKDLEALGYLMFAKKCETNAARSSDWDAAPRNTAAMNSNIKGGLQLWKVAKKEFFQWRYAYQVLRMAFYSGDYTRTASLYQELVGDKTAPNIMYYRCLSLKAGAAYKTGDYNTAAYLYSRAFEGTDDNKQGNYVSYDWCFRPHGENEKGPGADRSRVLALCKNNSEKAVIAIMDALHQYEDGLPLMQEAYQLDPKVKGLDVVMTREINKLEIYLLDPKLRSQSGFNNSYYTYSNYYYNTPAYESERSAREAEVFKGYERQLRELVRFGDRVYTENKVADRAFWPLSVAYLYFIQQDWKSCEDWIGKASALNPSGRMKNMLEVEKLLLTINKNNKLDAATEAKILPSLQWLEQMSRKDFRFWTSYRNLMTTVLPNVYMRQQDTIKALLCIAKGTTGPDGKGGYYSGWIDQERSSQPVYVDPGSSAELEQVTTARVIALKQWIKTAQKTAYESFLVKNPPYEQGALELYLGTRYLRQLDFAQAADMMKNVPAAAMKSFRFPDPFAERWIDTQEPADTTTVSDKYQFAKDMQQLKEQTEKGNADAKQLYRYANGLYSMTYYGLSWRASMYYRSGSDGLAYYADTTRAHLLPEYRNYYTAEKATLYYQQAFDRSNDPELKAKCLFMLSKCWQKNVTIANKNIWDPAANDDYYLYTLKSPYFSQLTQNYAQTNAFKSLHEECSYLRLYVRQAHKK